MESERLMMSKQLTLSDLKQLAADGALSSEQLIKLARTRQITAAQALEVSSLYGLNEAQMAYLRGLQTSGVAIYRLPRTNRETPPCVIFLKLSFRSLSCFSIIKITIKKTLLDSVYNFRVAFRLKNSRLMRSKTTICHYNSYKV